jgi:hypothetical protein
VVASPGNAMVRRALLLLSCSKAKPEMAARAGPALFPPDAERVLDLPISLRELTMVKVRLPPPSRPRSGISQVAPDVRKPGPARRPRKARAKR